MNRRCGQHVTFFWVPRDPPDTPGLRRVATPASEAALLNRLLTQ